MQDSPPGRDRAEGEEVSSQEQINQWTAEFERDGEQASGSGFDDLPRIDLHLFFSLPPLPATKKR